MYPIEKYSTFVKMIKEGLIKTHDINTATGLIDRYLISLNIKYEIIKNSNNTFMVEFDNIENLYDIVLRDANNLGYYPSYMIVVFVDHTYNGKFIYNKLSKNKDKIVNITFNFESKFDDKLSIKPKLLYHICKEKNLEKIKNIGLVAKSKSRISFHSERIYLFHDINEVNNLHNKFKINDKINNRNDTYYLLKIKNDNYVLYNDPNFYNKGCYTYDNVKKEDIVDIIKL